MSGVTHEAADVLLVETLAKELQAGVRQVIAAVALLDGGATVPFIARYRKEATGGLSDTHLRLLEERLGYLRDVEIRRQTILQSIEEQGKLTPELKQSLQKTMVKSELEDLYLPYRPKKRSKAQAAREAGLEPLAQNLVLDPKQDPLTLAARFLNPEKGIAAAEGALDGAREILMEKFSEDGPLIGKLREQYRGEGWIFSQAVKGKEAEGAKFSDYFSFQEQVRKIPSHRMLALLRGRSEGILRLALAVSEKNDEDISAAAPFIMAIADRFNVSKRGRAADAWLWESVEKTWKLKVKTQLDLDLMLELREQSDEEAIKVFAQNLKNLLLASPAGSKTTIGLDPGYRSGVKVTVIDKTGKVLDTAVIYPHAPDNDWEEALEVLAKLIKKYQAELIAIGNGTASRETDRLAGELVKLKLLESGKIQKVIVSEAGASVYSASELASEELPQLDVSLRGAVSIARRLQDPLAELVKIDPKAIGVGQYQHDVNQSRLGQALGHVVEDCVNAVGVDVNTASPALLSYVAGLNNRIAKNIVSYRDKNGPFKNRFELQKVQDLGPKAFEQAAGFLRIRGGENPLDMSAVHPEAYPLVERIIQQSQGDVHKLIGNKIFLGKIKAEQFVDEKFGLPTVRDVLAELEKPGRDPRPEFKTAVLKDGIEKIEDVKPGMMFEGTVTNVTNFGAFVDIGVHQDGLVHVSQLSDRFVKDPQEVVKTGQIVRVRVLEIDLPRKRISLTMKSKS